MNHLKTYDDKQRRSINSMIESNFNDKVAPISMFGRIINSRILQSLDNVILFDF